MSNDTNFDHTLALAQKLGGVGYEAATALRDLQYLREWVGNGSSRKTESMKSLCDELQKRLQRIITGANLST